MRATSRAARTLRTAPVSHQKRLGRSITNAIEIERKRSKINKADRYSAAHNGLVGGSSPPGPTKFRCFRVACTRMFAFDSRQSLVNRWSDGRGVLSYHGLMILFRRTASRRAVSFAAESRTGARPDRHGAIAQARGSASEAGSLPGQASRSILPCGDDRQPAACAMIATFNIVRSLHIPESCHFRRPRKVES